MESPLEAICRRAKERRQYVLDHPEEFTRDEWANAYNASEQSKRLVLASILRYE